MKWVNLFVPYMRELGSGIDQSIRNRNLVMEMLPGEDIPIKYDMLNGQPIRNYDFFTRAFNAVSPVSLNLTVSPGRQFLFESGYDLRMSTYYAPDGTNLSDSPSIRSRFQQAIGIQNLELALDKLAKNPRALASLQEMYNDINSGRRGDFNARDYWHNREIDKLFRKARRIAWNNIRQQSDILKLRKEQQEKKFAQIKKQRSTSNILNIYK